MVKTQKTVLFLLVALLCINCAFVSFAGSKIVLLPERRGEIETDESESFIFNVPYSGNCSIDFKGYDGDDGTYGGALITILNEQGETVFTKSVLCAFKNISLSVALSKGKYTLVMTENDDYTFEYIVSITLDGDSSAAAEIPVESIKLNHYFLNLSVSDTKALKASYKPTYAVNSVTWSSSNPKIVVVNQAGKIKAKSFGTAVITAKAKNKSASCTVVVNQAKNQILLGESKSFKGYIKNIDGFENAKWSSSNKNVVVVSKAGKATAKAAGKADLTVKLEGTLYTLHITVPKVKISQKQAEMHPGETLKLSMSGTAKPIEWRSSNKAVAAVNKNGTVTARSYGNAVITATVDGKKYACKVNVNYQTYGDVQGTVTYYFNRNYGQVPDVGARIYILDTSKKSIVSSGMADGNGNYEITGIPTGKYELVIVSAHATCLQDEDIADYYAEYGIFTYLRQIGRCDITLEEDMVITANKSFTVSSF